jgi:hypothetical protein
MFRVSAYDPESPTQLLDRPTEFDSYREALDFLRGCAGFDAYAELDILRAGQWQTIATLSDRRIDRHDRFMARRPPLPTVTTLAA